MRMADLVENDLSAPKKALNLKAIFSIVIVFIVLIFAVVFWNQNHPDLDYPAGTAGPEIEVNIPAGSSGVEIGRILAKAGVVKTSLTFSEQQLAINGRRVSLRVVSTQHSFIS